MKAEEEIVFLAELLRHIDELQDLVRTYIRVITSDQDGCMLEQEHRDKNMPF